MLLHTKDTVGTVFWFYLKSALVTIWKAAAPAKLTILHFQSTYNWIEFRENSKNGNLTYTSIKTSVSTLKVPIYSAHRRLENTIKTLVKVYRVFSSSCQMSASSRTGLFRWIDARDSEGIITSFKRVVTYTTRNFATFGLSGLEPPFTTG